MTDPLHRLSELFREFPGIGPRQAKRFSYALLTRSNEYLKELSSLIENVKADVACCTDCFRFAPSKELSAGKCSICRGSSRDGNVLMIVSRDIDLESIERSGAFRGRYFVLGGTIPILEKEPAKMVRLEALRARVTSAKSNGLTEVILGLSATPDGDHTGDIVREWLSPLDVKLSVLGRGLSTGTELEYSDGDTIVNALKNRF